MQIYIKKRVSVQKIMAVSSSGRVFPDKMSGCVFVPETRGSKPCRSKEPGILRELPFIYEGIKKGLLFSFQNGGKRIQVDSKQLVAAILAALSE